MSHKKHAPQGITKAQREKFLETRRIYGLFTRVANQLGLTRSHVRRVARGERGSRRVEKALREELDRLRGQAA